MSRYRLLPGARALWYVATAARTMDPASSVRVGAIINFNFRHATWRRQRD